ncbi:polyprenyl synthetase family protein [Arthrobacter sp. M4]|uniref:polyprenyl synthetase family protein n=1 Tax=Arthrobacter sp. M4 TaxID=218160 RepID=UPI001CDC0CD1|nr:polyprenyl synthetase family protein [Arthrobacter sp. M4]MCA4132787.1 polyprenyl synthetase family protein [Arthrobacter sp. M4]
MSASEQLSAERPRLEEEQSAFVGAVADRLASFVAGHRDMMASISADTAPLVDSIATLVTGGKRMRALLCYWGWRGAGGAPGDNVVVTAGAALELFQAAALIHDDIIDRSDTRRGAPSVHKRFSHLHSAEGWALDSERFGHAAAILTGDLCLSFSEESFSEIGPKAAAGTPARTIFNLMRAEVMAGQYLDILEEVAGPVRDRKAAVRRAETIIRYKSAKYSTEHPLALGGALANAPADLLEGYSAFALPLGEAFQLRDDVLGVFGDPATTGKPAGDDLREGKRTVLVGLTLSQAKLSKAQHLDRSLGRDDLTDEEVEELRRIIVECGALAATEEKISSLSDRAFAALKGLPIDELSMAALGQIARAAVRRSA